MQLQILRSVYRFFPLNGQKIKKIRGRIYFLPKEWPKEITLPDSFSPLLLPKNQECDQSGHDECENAQGNIKLLIGTVCGAGIYRRIFPHRVFGGGIECCFRAKSVFIRGYRFPSVDHFGLTGRF